jgi:hypothetical protein
MHPRDPETNEPYDWWDADIKHIPIYKKQIKKSEWVSQPAKDIGLGPVLFLHTMKAFAYLFCFFTILNIPLFMFYVKGQGPASLDRVESKKFTDVFGKIAIGNLGQSDFACSNFNIARNHTYFYFSCPYGTMRQLVDFGMQKLDNQSCYKDKAGTFLGEGDARFDF